MSESDGNLLYNGSQIATGAGDIDLSAYALQSTVNSQLEQYSLKTNTVDTTSNQTIAGVKQFADGVVLPIDGTATSHVTFQGASSKADIYLAEVGDTRVIGMQLFENSDGSAGNHVFKLTQNGNVYIDDDKLARITDVPSLDNYYTKTEVDTAISNVSGGSVDLSNYYTKTEVDASYATKSSVVWEINSQTKELRQGTTNVTNALKQGGFLMYKVVTAAPTTQEEGVLYIVTE